MKLFKWLSFIVILGLSVWLFVPDRESSESASADTTSAPAASTERGDVRFTLRIAPGVYMPGRLLMGVGEPLGGLAEVGRRFEALYPDTRVEFLDAPVTLREWLVTQLISGNAPDVVCVNVEDVWQDVQKGWYVPLDDYLARPNPFVAAGEPGSEQWWDLFKYQAITRGKAAPDGKYYCLTLDMVETGIFYNRDLFDELGLDVPTTWDELIACCEAFRRAGYPPLLTNIGSLTDWGLDLVFDQMYGDVLDGIDLLQDPVREQYLQGYLDWDELTFLHERGFFTADDPRWRETWRMVKLLRSYSMDDISVSAGSDMLRRFFTQKAGMFWDSSMRVYQLQHDPAIEFEWGVFYLPTVSATASAYASGKPMCVIGGSMAQLIVTNSAFGDTKDMATSERLQRVIAFLQFLTTPESAEAVTNETGCFLSNVKGVPVKGALQPFDDILRRRYTTTKWIYTFDLRFNEILQRLAELYFNDAMSEDDFLAAMEANVTAAVRSIRRRKRLDDERLQQRWEELAPVRDAMGGLGQ